MKDFVGIAFNAYLAELKSGKFVGYGEVIVVCQETQYDATMDGLGRRKAVADFRFAAGSDALREMARNLTEYADVLDAMAAKANDGPV